MAKHDKVQCIYRCSKPAKDAFHFLHQGVLRRTGKTEALICRHKQSWRPFLAYLLICWYISKSSQKLARISLRGRAALHARKSAASRAWLPSLPHSPTSPILGWLFGMIMLKQWFVCKHDTNNKGIRTPRHIISLQEGTGLAPAPLSAFHDTCCSTSAQVGLKPRIIDVQKCQSLEFTIKVQVVLVPCLSQFSTL